MSAKPEVLGVLHFCMLIPFRSTQQKLINYLYLCIRNQQNNANNKKNKNNICNIAIKNGKRKTLITKEPD